MERMRKYSYKREEIYRVIRSTKEHPSAEWIYMQLKPKIPDLSIGTVYRNLATFKSEGVVASVGVVNGQERFDGNTAPHTHFVCESCGSVIDVPTIQCDKSASERILREYGAEVAECKLSFHGKCKDCLIDPAKC